MVFRLDRDHYWLQDIARSCLGICTRRRVEPCLDGHVKCRWEPDLLTGLDPEEYRLEHLLIDDVSG
jgi:hypothetical protein